MISPIAAPGGPEPASAAASSLANTPPAASPPDAAPAASPAKPLNPENVIDPALGIDVVEYFNGAGHVTQSFPSQKQLATYRLYGLQAGESG